MESSDKETRAIFLNFKEVRSLEKNVQALDLEKAYNISLINLDQKVIKVKYKRLKDKVSRIKSHLQPSELEELKKLEEEGKLDVKIAASDLNLKITAAERRLKLMPRAKSAAPRLQNLATTEVTEPCSYRTPRSGRKLRIESTTTRPSTSMSIQSSKDNCNRSKIPLLARKPEEENTSVPNSARKERPTDTIRLNDSKSPKAQTIPTVNVSCVAENNKMINEEQSLSSKKAQEISIALSNPVENNSNFTSLDASFAQKGCESTDVNESINISEAINKTPDNGGSLFGTISDETSTFLQVPTESPVKFSTGSNSGNENKQYRSLRSNIRPMSVPAKQTTDLSKAPQKTRPKTAVELAIETRKKSVMEIRRASSMLKEGKTRSPFSCHEQDQEEKKAAPFRSIREGINTANNDTEIFDNTLGDDLHKEMKKGMILGEVATSLYLEDKIDTFLEKVDNYVKENPNYVYDPEAAKQKRVPRANKDKKSRPKRNRLRRRQLERQLHEANIEEMRKSRWLRLDDENLDTSGVNTLVVDQMKMLNKIRHPYDDDY